MAAPRYVCFLCKRKFNTAQLLSRHNQLSELHRRNLLKQDEEIQAQKEDLRQVSGAVKKQIQDIDLQISKQVVGPKNNDLQSQRSKYELKLKWAVSEYGQAQEKLEASRFQQMCERRNPGGNNGLPQKAEVHETRVGKLLISAGAASWQGNKEVQEDRYILDIQLEASGGQRIVGFAVCDGHSGSLCVDALVERLPKNLQKCVSSLATLSEDRLRQAVTEAILLTDEEFLSKAREREVLDGSTMILSLIYPDEGRSGAGESSQGRSHHRLLIANVGDSRAVLCRAQGGRLSAVRLSDDQKPGRADERRRIESNGGVVEMQGVWRVFTPGQAAFAGRSVRWGLAVSRAFGDILLKEPSRYGCQDATGALVCATPELHFYDLHPSKDRFLVLACDGVWDVLGDEEAVAVCLEHKSADLAAHALIRRSFEVGTDDNITAVVIAWQAMDAEEPGAKRARGAD
mmetsp:Transcript_67466/g.106248  ORF Transcript_67466/g.106248 Transcript_67466/m.106248 type:complete len:458 (+) Transcript_67466:164-1537(+)